MGRARERRPKSLILVGLLLGHPAAGALAYDWRARFGLPLSAARDGSMRWAEAWALTEQILRDPYSHTYSTLRGDTHQPHPALDAALTTIELWATAKSGPGKIPVRITRPWAGTPPPPGATASSASRDATASAQRRRALDARLGITT